MSEVDTISLLDWRFLKMENSIHIGNSEFVRTLLNYQSSACPTDTFNQSNLIIKSRDLFKFRCLVTLLDNVNKNSGQFRSEISGEISQEIFTFIKILKEGEEINKKSY